MSDNVKVVVRCRPMNEKEIAGGHAMAVSGMCAKTQLFVMDSVLG